MTIKNEVNKGCPERRSVRGILIMSDDKTYMARAIRLARRGIGGVSPNPAVGAVIVKRGRILAEGYHLRFGGPHAEVDALSRLESGDAAGATMYVTLEPCNHHGKTPPCTDAILEAGIDRVVVGMEDPNPLVRGAGIAKLRASGIEVVIGVLEEKCRRLNEPFVTCIEKNRPFVTLKIAQTLDGRIATPEGRSRWITGEAAREEVHRMRKASDAVLVGVNTVIADDPRLTVRHVRGGGGRRIILDSRLRTPLASRILHLPDPENTILVHTALAPKTGVEALAEAGVTLWRVRQAGGRVSLPSLLQRMKDAGIGSVLVEGGEAVFSSFLKSGVVDRIVAFIAPVLFGEGKPCFSSLRIREPREGIRFQETIWRRVGEDMMFEGRL